jgi:hypothetical protein
MLQSPVVSAAFGTGPNPLGIGVVPAFSIGMLRYRWFDIESLVSRTVSYGVVTLVVAGVYAIPVVLLPKLIAQSSDRSVALATLVADAAGAKNGCSRWWIDGSIARGTTPRW